MSKRGNQLPDGVTIDAKAIRQALTTSRRSEWSASDQRRLVNMSDGDLLAAANESGADIPAGSVDCWTADAREQFGADGSVLVHNVNTSSGSLTGNSGTPAPSSASDDMAGWENRASRIMANDDRNTQGSNADDGASDDMAGWENRAGKLD